MNKKNITCVVEQKLCHSCGACSAVCEYGAINFSETVGGYFFPEIDEKICTHCGLCYEVCPGIHSGRSFCAQMPSNPFEGNIRSAQVGKATDDRIFWNSQSGGVVTGLLKHLLDTERIEAAIVTTMRTGASPRTTAVVARTAQELMASQKSKYCPTPVLSLMPEIRKLNGPVALVGLSCHMHGFENLKEFQKELKRKVSIRIGLICDGVMSHAAVDFLALKATSEPITNFIFRDKQNPSYPGNVVVTTRTGQTRALDASCRIMIKEFFTPPRCHLCFDKMNLLADVVVGDPHELSGVDRQGGESLVLIRTEAGQKAVQEAVDAHAVVLRPVSAEASINGQKIQEKRQRWHAYSTAWQELGLHLPDYPFATLPCARYVTRKTVLKSKKVFNTAFSLDAFTSRAELLSSADKWLTRKLLAIRLKKLFGKAKKMLRVIFRRLKP